MKTALRTCTLLVWLIVSAETPPAVELHFSNQSSVTDRELADLEATIQQLFARGGIDISWTRCFDRTRHVTLDSGCEKHAGTAVLFQSRVDVQPKLNPHVLAPSTLGTGRATIFYARARMMANAATDVSVGQILGHVAVHEIVHRLLGPDHSTSGVMKQTALPGDLRDMAQDHSWSGRTELAQVRSALIAAQARTAADERSTPQMTVRAYSSVGVTPVLLQMSESEPARMLRDLPVTFSWANSMPHSMISLLAIGPAVLAQKPAEDAGATVRVHVVRKVYEPNLNLLWAQNIASQIFAGAGVHIKWQLREPRRDEKNMPIIIDLTSDAPKMFAPGALAWAQVYEGVHISVFCDRIKNQVGGRNRLGTFLLAHVMAHEIAHIIEGVDRHSETGLMKAHWTNAEIEGMSVTLLSLAPEDVQLIHKGLFK